jgi:immune inhibitor A
MASNAYDTAINALRDLQKYDNDGNGFVDAFIVVHAGRGAEETGNTENIWSLKWQLPTPKSDHGETAFGFLTVPEDAKLGVCVHEIGHLVFGWPDLYDSKPQPTGQWRGHWGMVAHVTWIVSYIVNRRALHIYRSLARRDYWIVGIQTCPSIRLVQIHPRLDRYRRRYL